MERTAAYADKAGLMLSPYAAVRSVVYLSPPIW